jgi:hypothetical protein
MGNLPNDACAQNISGVCVDRTHLLYECDDATSASARAVHRGCGLINVETLLVTDAWTPTLWRCGSCINISLDLLLRHMCLNTLA